MSANALPHVEGPVFELNPELMKQGIEASRKSPRKRMILPIHRKQGALVQRMLNFLQPGTYVQPHVHGRESASETIFVMQGELGFVIFDEAGAITGTHTLKAGGLIDIEPNVWHGLVCLAPDTVILEVKRGPFDPSLDKTFATWAPEENSPKTNAYLKVLVDQFQKLPE